MQITPQSRVTLHFAIKLLDGAVVDSNFTKDPVSFAMGDGSLLAGFEQKLLGMAAGDKATFAMQPAEAFGEHKEENVHNFARAQLAEYHPEPGLVITFADAANAQVPGVVKAVSGDSVTVDFNHPLAGRELLFEVAIVNVEQANGVIHED